MEDLHIDLSLLFFNYEMTREDAWGKIPQP